MQNLWPPHQSQALNFLILSAIAMYRSRTNERLRRLVCLDQNIAILFLSHRMKKNGNKINIKTITSILSNSQNEGSVNWAFKCSKVILSRWNFLFFLGAKHLQIRLQEQGENYMGVANIMKHHALYKQYHDMSLSNIEDHLPHSYTVMPPTRGGSHRQDSLEGNPLGS